MSGSSGGGGQSSQTTVQQSDPWIGAQPYLLQAYEIARQLSRGAIPGFTPPNLYVPGQGYKEVPSISSGAWGSLGAGRWPNPYKVPAQTKHRGKEIVAPERFQVDQAKIPDQMADLVEFLMQQGGMNPILMGSLAPGRFAYRTGPTTYMAAGPMYLPTTASTPKGGL